MKIVVSKDYENRWNLRKKSFLSILFSRLNSKFIYSPFGKVADLEDFRGYSFAKNTIKNLEINNVDFSYANFSCVRFEGCTFKNVSFNQANMEGFKDHGNVFESCSFKSTNLSNSSLGFDGSVYRDCTFEKTSFSRVSFSCSDFVHCGFIHVNLNNIDFDASSFEDCVFEGRLESVWFCNGFRFPEDAKRFQTPKTNSMKRVSFENAELLDIMYVGGVDLRSVILPSVGNYRFYENWIFRLDRLSKEIVNYPIGYQEEIALFVKCYYSELKKTGSIYIEC